MISICCPGLSKLFHTLVFSFSIAQNSGLVGLVVLAAAAAVADGGGDDDFTKLS